MRGIYKSILFTIVAIIMLGATAFGVAADDVYDVNITTDILYTNTNADGLYIYNMSGTELASSYNWFVNGASVDSGLAQQYYTTHKNATASDATSSTQTATSGSSALNILDWFNLSTTAQATGGTDTIDYNFTVDFGTDDDGLFVDNVEWRTSIFAGGYQGGQPSNVHRINLTIYVYNVQTDTYDLLGNHQALEQSSGGLVCSIDTVNITKSYLDSGVAKIYMIMNRSNAAGNSLGGTCDGVAVTGTTGLANSNFSSYDKKSAILSSSNFVEQDVLILEITPNNGTNGTAVNSSSVTVLNTAPQLLYKGYYSGTDAILLKNTFLNFNSTCGAYHYDLDVENSTGYVNWYVDDTLNSSTSVADVENATLFSTTLFLNSSIYTGSTNLTCELWFGDGEENTTKYNDTSNIYASLVYDVNITNAPLLSIVDALGAYNYYSIYELGQYKWYINDVLFGGGGITKEVTTYNNSYFNSTDSMVQTETSGSYTMNITEWFNSSVSDSVAERNGVQSISYNFTVDFGTDLNNLPIDIVEWRTSLFAGGYEGGHPSNIYSLNTTLYAYNYRTGIYDVVADHGVLETGGSPLQCSIEKTNITSEYLSSGISKFYLFTYSYQDLGNSIGGVCDDFNVSANATVIGVVNSSFTTFGRTVQPLDSSNYVGGDNLTLEIISNIDGVNGTAVNSSSLTINASFPIASNVNITNQLIYKNITPLGEYVFSLGTENISWFNWYVNDVSVYADDFENLNELSAASADTLTSSVETAKTGTSHDISLWFNESSTSTATDGNTDSSNFTVNFGSTATSIEWETAIWAGNQKHDNWYRTYMNVSLYNYTSGLYEKVASYDAYQAQYNRWSGCEINTLTIDDSDYISSGEVKFYIETETLQGGAFSKSAGTTVCNGVTIGSSGYISALLTSTFTYNYTEIVATSTLDTDYFSKGNNITYEIIPNNVEEGNGTAVNSTTIIVQNSLPMSSGAEIYPTTATALDTLKGRFNFTDEDTDVDDASSSVYTWFVDDVFNSTGTVSLVTGETGNASDFNAFTTINQTATGGTLDVGAFINSSTQDQEVFVDAVREELDYYTLDLGTGVTYLNYTALVWAGNYKWDNIYELNLSMSAYNYSSGEYEAVGSIVALQPQYNRWNGCERGSIIFDNRNYFDEGVMKIRVNLTTTTTGAFSLLAVTTTGTCEGYTVGGETMTYKLLESQLETKYLGATLSGVLRGSNATFQIIASDAEDNATAINSSTIVIGNALPVVSTLNITPTTAYTTNNLTGKYTYSDGDSDSEGTSWYNWFINGILKFSGIVTSVLDSIKLGTELNINYYLGTHNDGEDRRTHVAGWVNSSTPAEFSGNPNFETDVRTYHSFTPGADKVDIFVGAGSSMSINSPLDFDLYAYNHTGSTWNRLGGIDLTWDGNSCRCENLTVTIEHSDYFNGGVVNISAEVDSYKPQISSCSCNGRTSGGMQLVNFTFSSYSNGALLNSTNISKGDDVILEIIPNDGTENGTAVNSSTLTILNSVPVTASSINPAGGETFTGDASNNISINFTAGSDADSDALTYYVLWSNDSGSTYSDLTTLVGTNNVSYAWNSSNTTLYPSASTYRVRVVTSDGTINSTANVSSGSDFTITHNTAPNLTSIQLLPITVYTNDSANCSAIYNDSEADSGTVYYNWYINSTVNETGTLSVSDGDFFNITLNNSYYDKGYTITCELWAGDGTANSTAVNTSKVVDNLAPSGILSIIYPTAGLIVNTDSSPMTLEWTAVTDPDGDTVIYIIEYNYSGYTSAPFANYGSTTDTSYNITIDNFVTADYIFKITPSDGSLNGTAVETDLFVIEKTAGFGTSSSSSSSSPTYISLAEQNLTTQINVSEIGNPCVVDVEIGTLNLDEKEFMYEISNKAGTEVSVELLSPLGNYKLDEKNNKIIRNYPWVMIDGNPKLVVTSEGCEQEVIKTLEVDPDDLFWSRIKVGSALFIITLGIFSGLFLGGRELYHKGKKYKVRRKIKNQGKR